MRCVSGRRARCRAGCRRMEPTRRVKEARRITLSPAGSVQTVDRQDLVEKIESGDPIRLVMALNEWAFRAKHIPGSEHFNTPEELFAGVDPDEQIIVYCTSEKCHSSLALYEALIDGGYRDVRRYSGGLTDWDAAGLPLEGDWSDEAALRLGRGFIIPSFTASK